MYPTVYVTTADWNDTRLKDPKFDNMVLDARGELNEAKRKALYRDVAVIVPFFNQFIDAAGSKVGGYSKNPAAELMDGYALAECWLTA